MQRMNERRAAAAMLLAARSGWLRLTSDGLHASSRRAWPVVGDSSKHRVVLQNSYHEPLRSKKISPNLSVSRIESVVAGTARAFMPDLKGGVLLRVKPGGWGMLKEDVCGWRHGLAGRAMSTVAEEKGDYELACMLESEDLQGAMARFGKLRAEGKVGKADCIAAVRAQVALVSDMLHVRGAISGTDVCSAALRRKWERQRVRCSCCQRAR